MTARRSPGEGEITISDGQRHLGTVISKSQGFECYGPDGRYLFKCPSIPEARAAVIRADREQQRELARLEDDGGRAA